MKLINPIVGIAIICLTLIEIFAMNFGVNGTLRTLIVGAICALAGWRIPTREPIGEPIRKTIEVKL